MTHEWKVGDRAAFKEPIWAIENNTLKVVCGTGGHYYLLSSDIEPLPPAITPEATAVLDAAVEWAGPAEDIHNLADILSCAVHAYRASLTPFDPVDELIGAATDALGFLQGRVGKALLDKIAAVERSRAK